MVHHKSVHFGDSGSEEKSPSPKSFREPQGMTNVDLTNFSTAVKEMGGGKIPTKVLNPTKKKLSVTIRKSIIKSLVIFAILTFGSVTFLCLMPDEDINACKEALHNIFQRPSTLPTINPSDIQDLSEIIRTHYDIFQKCKITRIFKDCCILHDMGKEIIIQDCTVDGVLYALLQYDQEYALTILLKEVDEKHRKYDTHLNDHLKNSVYNHDDVERHKRAEDENKFRKNKKYKPNLEPSYIKTSVLIEKMSTPVIKDNDVKFETSNSNIKIFKNSSKKKRSVPFDPQNNMHRQRQVFNFKRNFPVHFFQNYDHPNRRGFGRNFDENDYHESQQKQHEHIYHPIENENTGPYYPHNPLYYEPHLPNVGVESGGYGQHFRGNLYAHSKGMNLFVQNPQPKPNITNVDIGNVESNQGDETSKIHGSTYPTNVVLHPPNASLGQNQDEPIFVVKIPLEVELTTSNVGETQYNMDWSRAKITQPFRLIQQVRIPPKELVSETKISKHCSVAKAPLIYYMRKNVGDQDNVTNNTTEDRTLLNENDDTTTMTTDVDQSNANDNASALNDNDEAKSSTSKEGELATKTPHLPNQQNYDDKEIPPISANQINLVDDKSDDRNSLNETDDVENSTKKPYLQNRLNDDEGNARFENELRNVPQGDFQNKVKISTEDLQISQHNSANPNFNQQPCVPNYSPQVSSPYRLIQPSSYGYDPNPRFAQLIPIPRTPTNSYVINPQYTYVNPNYPQIVPNYVINSYYNNQNVPNTSPIQVSGPGGQYYVCNPIPTPTNQLTNIPGVEVRQSEPFNWQDSLENTDDINGVSNNSRSSNRCPFGEQSCADGVKCIKISHICDGDINCDDGSDETFCSCKSRVGPSRLCDGYLDCPNGEDETGCFGCSVNMFNCDDWSHDRGSSCIIMEERCDGVPQCPTGRDEENCSMLTEDFAEKSEAFKISNVMGYLYRNYKGKWYPSCSNPEAWALDVCQTEAGPSNLPPLTHMVPIVTKYNGPYVNALPNNEAVIVDTCVHGRAVYVECPHPTCGMRMSMRNPYRSEEVDTSDEEDFARFRNKRSNQTGDLLGDSRVVGGKPSQPAAWPWIVSIYRNGVFHCGGVLVSETCVVTAAHCVDKFTQYYYEVEAGILRRFSYSPMEQTRYVSDVIAHQAYDRANLKNDLALMRLSAPLKYNRYVRPICLPNELTAGHSYLKGPPPDTLCTAVGWGATVEHGSDPDHLREVEVPVLRHCKHKEDEEGHEICAGFIEGGRDACQGDSGGPFMCRNPNQPNQWYLAGIVSHGEGCARPNEPGVYTRVSLYRNWIYENAHNGIFPSRKPLNKCPGFVCKSTGRCIPKKRHCDRVVDCLLADDETHCEQNMADLFRHAMSHLVMLGVAQNSTHTADETGEPLTTPKDVIAEQPGKSVANISNDADTILGMENRTPITDISDGENFGPNELPDSFTTRSDISDGTQFITNTDATTETSVTALISHESYYGHKVDDILDNSQNKIPRAKHFRCKRMLELIPLSKRCDKIADCQDATDEAGCTCRDYLGNFYPAALCDGITDCYDFSDEKGCDTCQSNEFRCPSSNVCISIDKICDNVPDCPQKEDESDCFALTDGRTILLDDDQRPQLKPKGIFTFYFRGSWLPMCANWTAIEAKTATTLCLLLGFADYENFSQLRIEQKPLTITPVVEKITQFEISHVNCNGLFVKCSNVSINSRRIAENDFQTGDRRNLYPWNAAIFADGKYECMGMLINLDWVLTSSYCFPGILKLQHYYISVLLGSTNAYTRIAGPSDEVRLVVESVRILYSDIVILRLKQSAKFSRYVRPINFFKRNNIGRSNEICVAVGKNINDKLETVFLQPILNCTSGSRCFKRTGAVGEECNSTSRPWSGSIICDSGNGFSPVAVYYEKQGECGFAHTTSCTSVSLLKRAIFNAMEQPVFAVDPPECNGFRCKLGRCLEFRAICDGIPDCRDGADEDEAACAMRDETCHLTRTCDCPKSEMKCRNDRCVSKTAFCDKIDDCGDNSDEPTRCNCRTYLELSDPAKICDGIVNCLDKSDESPEICGCTGGKFNCSTNDNCVPTEMVCDGQNDCPDGKDEETCLSLRSSNDNLQFGEVMTNTAGVWHPGCFPERPTTTELESICSRLGFTGESALQIQPEDGKNASVPQPTFDKFSLVRIHNNAGATFKLVIRSGREPFVSFADSDDCYRLFLQCL